jgi:hypothetical protein
MWGCSDSDDIPPPPLPPAPIPDSTAPDAKILFPSSVSKTNAANITVSGIATDDSGVTRVTVNGKSATLKQLDDGVTAYWSVNVPVSETLLVETEDVIGNVESNAASARIVTGEVPNIFAVDNINHQFIGTVNGGGKMLVRDLVSGLQTQHTVQYPPSFSWARHLHYISQEGKFAAMDDCCGDNFHLALSEPNAFEFHSLLEYQVPKSFGDWLFKSTSGIDYDAENNRLFVNFTLFFEDSDSASHIIQFDFDTEEVKVLLDGEDADGQHINARNVAYSNSALYFYSTSGLKRLPLDTLIVETVDSSAPGYARNLLSSISRPNEIYAISLDEFFKINTVSNEYRSISRQSEQSELLLSQWYQDDIDEHNNQVLVHDEDLDMIMGVDIDSGKRSRFFHSGVGIGKAIIDPWALGIDEERNRIYLFDSGVNAPETILAIDMTTGNRTEVGQVNRSVNWGTNSLVLDTESNVLYALFPEEIARVDINSNTTEELTGGELGGGVDVTWLDNAVLDKANNRILATDNDRIIAIDLNTGFRSIFSSAAENVGEGEAFGRIGDITMNALNTHLYATGLVGDKPGLFEVSLTTGDRALVNNICEGIPAYSDITRYGDSYPHQTMILSPQDNSLNIFGTAKFTINLKTNTCVASQFTRGRDIVQTRLGQWFSVTADTLVQIDAGSNEQVIVSK